MQSHHVCASLLFLASLGVGSFAASPTFGIAAVCAGAFIAGVFLLYPVIEGLSKRKGRGEISFSPAKGATIKWEVRSDQPIRTIFPEKPTNSTENQEAIRLCDEGRALIKRKSSGEDVSLDVALEKFRQSAILDPKYWEPRINIAECSLLSGRMMEAFSEAESIRLLFSETAPLAFVKAGLIMAKVIEEGISPEDQEDDRRSRYRVIANLLRENLEKYPGHLTSMKSMGRVLLLAGAPEGELKNFLLRAKQSSAFDEEFRMSLAGEGMTEAFSSQFPEFFEEGNDDED